MAKFRVIYHTTDSRLDKKEVEAAYYVASTVISIKVLAPLQPDGVLHFYDENGMEIAAFASGNWIWVERIEECHE